MPAGDVIGSSRLGITIPVMVPRKPDVAEDNHLPGGVLTPLSPQPGAPAFERTGLPVKFPDDSGSRISISRIYLQVPVLLAEYELEKQTTNGRTRTFFNTPAETDEAVKGVGGHPGEVATANTIGPRTRYESAVTTSTYFNSAGVLEQNDTTTTRRSVLPTTVQLVVSLLGPEGVLWSDAFDVDIGYVEGEPGTAGGMGLVAAYADLNNALLLDPAKPYGLRLAMKTDTAVTTNTQLGNVVSSSGAITSPGGEAVLFYDVIAATLNK